MTADTPRLRLAIVGVVAISLFAALFARLWYLQVLVGPEYRLAAQANQVRIVDEPAPRGRILDRNGIVLVDNRASNVVAIERSQLGPGEARRLLERVSPILGLPVPLLAARLDDARVDPFAPVVIAEDVDESVMVRIRERQDELPAVIAEQVALRSYPHESRAAHVLGYVGEITAEELEDREGEYQLGDGIGKAGVEAIYEETLRGRDGEVRVEVDSGGKPIRVIERRPAVQGHDVVLSIDLRAQIVAEESLDQGLAAARGRLFVDDDTPFVADAGAVVVLDAKEGTVVAMASYPTFDLPGLANGISPSEAEVLFGEDTGAPFTNRAVQGQYAPGSTWKLVTAHAALRQGLITADTTLVDRGVYEIPNCRRGCTRRNAGSQAHGVVDLRRAMAVSSDVYFYALGADFWAEQSRYGQTAIQDAALELGFGAETGIPFPAEADGRLPTPESRAALHAENPDAFPEGQWFVGDNVNLAIGQGELTVTPIQIANAYAAYGNGGIRYAPNLALRIQDQDGTLIDSIAPRVASRIDLPPSMRDPILDGFLGAVAAPGGTAVGAFAGFPLNEYPVAGKTGTAQAKPKQDTALFAAMAPADDPRYVVSVVMEQAGFGSAAAAPVARSLFGQLSGLESGEFVEFETFDGARE